MAWTTAALLVAATVAIAVLGSRGTAQESARTGLCGAAALVGALAWIALAAGDTGPSAGSSGMQPSALAWIVAAPLLLAALAFTAAPLPDVRAAFRRIGEWEAGTGPLLGALLPAGIALAATGAVASTSQGAVAWIWFVAQIAILAVVAFVIWRPLADSSRKSHPLRMEAYDHRAVTLIVLLALHPLVALAGPSLTGVVSAGAAHALRAFADIAVLGGFGLYVVLDDARLAGVDAGGSAVPHLSPALTPRSRPGKA